MMSTLEPDPITEIQLTEVDFAVESRRITRGQIISVWGPIGSTGKSTIAVNVAFELAHTGHRVLLIDLDTYAPSIETQLNLIEHPAGLAAACRLASQDRLDEAEILRLSQPVQISANTLHIMTGISNPGRWPEISSEKIEALLDIAACCFDYIVLDLGSEIADSVQEPMSGIERNCATQTGLQNSNIILAVGLGDPIGIRRLILATQELKTLRLDADLYTVVNRTRSSAIGRKPREQISETLSRFAAIDVDLFIPDEPQTFDQCLLESIPLMTARRKSAARIEISKLTKRLILAETNSLDHRVAKLN
jgi:MinD-like ATPase involved in chromosome partitioning or flagellar assembly